MRQTIIILALFLLLTGIVVADSTLPSEDNMFGSDDKLSTNWFSYIGIVIIGMALYETVYKRIFKK